MKFDLKFFFSFHLISFLYPSLFFSFLYFLSIIFSLFISFPLFSFLFFLIFNSFSLAFFLFVPFFPFLFCISFPLFSFSSIYWSLWSDPSVIPSPLHSCFPFSLSKILLFLLLSFFFSLSFFFILYLCSLSFPFLSHFLNSS